MSLQCRKFTENDAAEVCTWRYPVPYDVYNHPDWETVKARGRGLGCSETREKEFYAVADKEKLLGFFRMAPEDGRLTIGLGLRPDACGKGKGKSLMSLIIRTARGRYGPIPLRLEVRTFNLRAFRCYQRAGFRVIGPAFEKETSKGRDLYFAMELRD